MYIFSLSFMIYIYMYIFSLSFMIYIYMYIFGSLSVASAPPSYLVTAETSKVAKGSDTVFIVACVLTALTLFALGAVKAKIVRQKWWLGGLHMLLVGIVTAAVSFLIGLTIAEIIGEDAAGAA
jgi:VIT1/CCC1 family predicted Fe2+/Mn2+ transporter